MIDLTPLDVRKKRGDFRRILRGYDPEEVDTFMDLVAERFEELVRENLSLSEKTDRIEGQLEALEGREKAVQEALVTAQKLRADVKDQSRQDAEVVQAQAIREVEILKAETDAEIGRRLGEAEGLIRERQRALEELERSRLKFLKSFRGLLGRELDAVEVEEARRPLEDVTLDLELRGWAPGGELEAEAGEAEAEEAEAGEAEVVEEEAVAEESVEEEVVEALERVWAAADEPQADLQEAWAATDDTQPEPEGVEAAEDEPVAEEGPEGEAETEDEFGDEPAAGIPDGFETQVLEGAVPAGLSAILEEEPQLQPEIESATDFEGELKGEPELEPEIEPAPAPAPETEPDGRWQSTAGIETESSPSPEEERSSSSSRQEPKWLFSLLKKEEEERGGEG